MKPFERLSAIYDLEWGQWALRYIPLIAEVQARLGIASARVLDLGCGTGVLANELARRGCSVVGFDSSPQMIKIAVSHGHPATTFAVQDMSEFSCEGEFDMVTCTFDSLNYLLTSLQVERFFASVARVISPDGVLLFDSNTEKLYESQHSGTREVRLGGCRIVQRCDYDATSKLATTIFEYEDGRFEKHLQRPYSLADLNGPIDKAGLEVIQTHSHMDNQPFGADSLRLICIVGLRSSAAISRWRQG